MFKSHFKQTFGGSGFSKVTVFLTCHSQLDINILGYAEKNESFDDFTLGFIKLWDTHDYFLTLFSGNPMRCLGQGR